MEKAAVAMVDVLGFKDHLRSGRIDPESLLKIMQELDKFAKDEANRPILPGTDFFLYDYQTLFLSDTLILACAFGEDGYEDIPMCLKGMAAILRTMHELFIQRGLLMRGCVSFGDVLIQDNFIAGEAALDVAECVEQSYEAVIWVHENALPYAIGLDDSYVAAKVTLKKGATDTCILDIFPKEYCIAELSQPGRKPKIRPPVPQVKEEVQSKMDMMLDLFLSEREDVQKKKQLTKELLENVFLSRAPESTSAKGF